PDRPLQRPVVARPPPGPDHRRPVEDPQSQRSAPVRDGAAGHARRLHPGLDLSPHPPVPARAPRLAARGGRAPQPGPDRAPGGPRLDGARGAGKMTDAGFVIAAYTVILGGIGLYAALLVRRLRNARAAGARSDDDTPR